MSTSICEGFQLLLFVSLCSLCVTRAVRSNWVQKGQKTVNVDLSWIENSLFECEWVESWASSRTLVCAIIQLLIENVIARSTSTRSSSLLFYCSPCSTSKRILLLQASTKLRLFFIYRRLKALNNFQTNFNFAMKNVFPWTSPIEILRRKCYASHLLFGTWQHDKPDSTLTWRCFLIIVSRKVLLSYITTRNIWNYCGVNDDKTSPGANGFA